MKSLNFQLLEHDVVASTNKTIKQVSPRKEGTFVLAKEQTQGRGSGTRSWHSPLGGLYLSGLLRVKPKDSPTVLSILAGAAITQTLRSTLPNSCKVSVKWPNDCLVNDRKIAGVLSELIEDGPSPLCVVGMGINVNLPPSELKAFESNRFPATSMQVETMNTRHDLYQVTKTLLQKIKALYELYWTDGFSAISEVWESNCHHVGKRIQFSAPSPQSGQGPVIFPALLQGIDSAGGIMLSNDQGVTQTHYVGEILCFLP